MAYGQLRFWPTTLCGRCPAQPVCDERNTEHGCDNEYDGRDVMHPARSDLAERMGEVRTLDIVLRTHRPQHPLPTLPSFIPCVQPQGNFWSPSCDTVAVPVDRVKPTAPVTPASIMKDRLGLSPDATMILTCFQHDDILERVWKHRRRFVETAAEAGYDLVTALSFSVWKGDPPVEHRYNIRRSIIMFESLVDAGVPTVPHVAWLLDRELEDWIAALRGWPGLRAFSLDWATVAQRGWSDAVRGLRRLIGGIGTGWEVLVNGVAHPHRIKQMSDICGHVHVISAKPFHVATSQAMSLDELLALDIRVTPKTNMERFAEEERKEADAVPAPPSSCALRAVALVSTPPRAHVREVP